MQYVNNIHVSNYMFTEDAKQKGIVHTAYGGVIYMPPQPKVYFGQETWPPKFKKSEVAPRVIMVSNWTDGRYWLPGGRCNREESPLNGLNREFEEEIGYKAGAIFRDEDYCFSVKINERTCSHIYARIYTDLAAYNEILSSFHLEREAYIDEVFGLASLPLWIEGPDTIKKVKWGNSIHGLPKMLAPGGAFKTKGDNNRTREQFLLLLRCLNILDDLNLSRTFYLTSFFQQSVKACAPDPKLPPQVQGLSQVTNLHTWKEFISTPGIKQILQEVTDAAQSQADVDQAAYKKARVY